MDSKSSGLAVNTRYEEEKRKRTRSEGMAQFLDIDDSEHFKHLTNDLWEQEFPFTFTADAIRGGLSKVAIVGAGFGGILFAIRMVQAGFEPSDIVLIDRAKSWGGTWYWNRYPGLMCDIESYLYLPFLEETNYMPKHKYSYGPEIRNHAERLVKHWNLQERGLFDTEVKEASWDDKSSQWVLKLALNKSHDNILSELRCDVLSLGTSFLGAPKLPKIPGMSDFKGHIFHTCRWDYAYTGGSSDDWTLSKLSNKKVAIVGTGATAIQVVPELARWAKEVYVVQRTPSGIDVRGQQDTNAEWWKTVSSEKGWQESRMENFLSITSNMPDKPTVDLVQDGWSKHETIVATTGGPELGGLTPEASQNYVRELFERDWPRTQRIRDRVNEIVKDKKTAAGLKAWYYSWCKRPCFHDEYLESFNQSHVHLVDTDGRGLSRVTERGFVVGDHETNVDAIIFSTGFGFLMGHSPAAQAGITVRGRNGMNLDDKWLNRLSTLHGLLTRDFPNLFLPSSSQTVLSPNHMYTLGLATSHAAYILSEARRRAEDQGYQRFTVEPTEEGESSWADLIIGQTMPAGIRTHCTAGYYNNEGENLKQISDEESRVASRRGLWNYGPILYCKIIRDWEERGELEGIDLRFM